MDTESRCLETGQNGWRQNQDGKGQVKMDGDRLKMVRDMSRWLEKESRWLETCQDGWRKNIDG